VQAEYIAGVKVLAKRISASNVEQMRELADRLRQSLGSAVIVLGAVIHDKPMLIAAVTPDLVEKGVQAGKLLSNVAKIFGGGGGGKPTMAQAGGEDASKLDAALRQVPVEVGSELQQLR
jgi:alanyl-tRNA synthetase